MKKVAIALAFLSTITLGAQTPKNLSSSEIYHRLQKLNTVGSALYIAAHPDDENTRLISYFANQLKLETSYFSFTRGNGGQNLISEKLGDELGIIRTYELLNARKIDGGKQYFSTANDFGYSKLPYEAFDLWEKELVLDQLVYAIRTLQPDVIVNRFDHRKEGITHGHHTASAQLSEEAFRLAADPNYATKVGPTSPWQAQRLFFNVSYWFFGSKSQFDKADKSSYHTIDMGVYYPLLGFSNQEIASISRSQHQSQGFGDMSSRGSDIEYLEQIAGTTLPKNSHNLLEGIDTSWKRIPFSENVQREIDHLLQTFDFVTTDNNIDALVSIYKQIQKLPDSYYKTLKLKETQELIVSSLGFYAEFSGLQSYWTNDSENNIKYEFSNRSNHPIQISNILIEGNSYAKSLVIDPKETKVDYIENIKISKQNTTEINWLNKNLQFFENQFDTKTNTSFNLRVKDIDFQINKPLVYKYKDEVKGEIHQPLHIVDPIYLDFKEKTYYGYVPTVEIQIDNLSKEVSGTVQLYQNGKLILEDKKTIPEKEKLLLSYNIFTTTVETKLEVKFIANNTTYDSAIHWVNYPHIPNQYFTTKAESKVVVATKIKNKRGEIAYVMGAGDEIPKHLEQLGYKVHLLADDEIKESFLRKFKTVIVGIRAYNTREILKTAQKDIFKYIENGGNWLVQYQTSHNLLTEDFAPYPLKLSKDRITDENATVTFLQPKHLLLNHPNSIGKEDFKHWIQEQGLYYVSEADSRYDKLLESNDPFDDPIQGALVTANYGKGRFTYTGLSFFRQIPNGNFGAMKLLINLIENEYEK